VLFFYLTRFITFISRSHWFFLWIALELNTVMFFPLLAKKKHTFNFRLCLNYFLIQRLISLIILFRLFNCEIANHARTSPKICIFAALLIKIASIPFHRWMLPIIKTNKTIVWLLLTAQKVLAFLMLIFIKPLITEIILVVLFISILLSPILGLSQNHTNILLFFSSISHTRWLIVGILLGQETWLFYFVFYSCILYLFLFETNTSAAQEIRKSSSSNMLTFISLMSLGGIPPLVGFYPKILIIIQRFLLTLFLLFFFLLMRARLDLFIYARLGALFLVLKKSKTIWSKQKKNNKLIMFITLTALFIFVLIF
jgi:NADH-ubiquinone oxidoreductase chain 2